LRGNECAELGRESWRGGGALPFGFDKLNPGLNYPIIVQDKRLWESGDLPKPFYFRVFFQPLTLLLIGKQFVINNYAHVKIKAIL